MTDCRLLDFLGSRGAGSADGLVMCFLQPGFPSSGFAIAGCLSFSVSRPRKVSSVSEVSDLSSSFSISLRVGLSLHPLLEFFDSERVMAWLMVPLLGSASRLLRFWLNVEVLRLIVGRRAMPLVFPLVASRAGRVVQVGWNLVSGLAEHGA